MISKIKLIIIGIVTIVLISLSTIVAIQAKKISNLNENLSYANANEKALMLENDSNKNHIRGLLLTVDLLNYFNDSIISALNKTKKELSIKDKNLKHLLYLETVSSTTDTILLRDTIFVEDVCLDTTISDLWHSTELSLCYPNSITVTPTFESKKVIAVHLTKETIDPPSKCWLVRLFQKKHKVVTVDIKEESPYITTKEYKYIEIIN